jgi:hypothetical protein
MSEKPFFTPKRAAIAATGLVVGTALVAAGQNANNANHVQDRIDASNEHDAEVEAYHDSIEAAVNAAYDRKAVVGEIDVVYGTRPIDEAERILREALGEDVYKENRAHLYDYLEDSAQIFTSQGDPQPGQKLYVVEVDMDPEKNNGSEYIVTDGNGGIIEEQTSDTLPSPTTH